MTRGFRPKFVITNRITSGLTTIEHARGFLEALGIIRRKGVARKSYYVLGNKVQ